MPATPKLLRPERSQEELELFLAEEFFKQFPLEYGVPHLQNQRPPAPDVLAQCDQRPAIPIEITELICNTGRGGSPERRRKAAFRLLQEALAHEMVHHPKFAGYGGHLSVKGTAKLTSATAATYAAAVREFVLRNCSELKEGQSRSWHYLDRDQPVEGWFANEPALKPFLITLQVYQHGYPNIGGPVRWQQWDGAFHLQEVTPQLLLNAIESKVNKKYDRPHAEIWLLLAAIGQTKDDHFDWLVETPDSLFDADVVAAAVASGFLRVIVWNCATREFADLLDPAKRVFMSNY